MDRQMSEAREPKLVSIDIENVEQCVGFAVEVILRASYFGSPAGMLRRDVEKNAYRNLENMFNNLRPMLKERMERFGKEYDSIGDPVQGQDSQDDSPEQVGREGTPDSQV